MPLAEMADKWFAGLMTGTVLDGEIDIAFLRTDGQSITGFGPAGLMPYAPDLRDLLVDCLDEARHWNFVGPEPDSFAEAEKKLTLAQSDALAGFAQEHDIALGDIAAIGFHGQTVLHRPPADGQIGRTRQLGDGQLMAERTGVPVVFDLRSGDIQAGGQGAPLCPCYHAALLETLYDNDDVAVLNLGGVGNITWKGSDGRLVAFDTGPANAPVNDWVKYHGLGEMDRDGALAASGTVDENRLTSLMQHPHFAAPFPKSLDRFDFKADLATGLSPADGAALLTHLAAASVARALRLLPVTVKRLVVCGGGRHNPTLMGAIETRSGITAEKAESCGWRGDAIEAECFAYLAARHMAGLNVSYPETTGVPTAMPAGRLARPQLSGQLARKPLSDKL